MKTYKGKKLLIMSGASVHCKLVETAKNMGIYTIVTDYLESSPAKEMADEQWFLDVNDIDGIVQLCKEKEIDGIVTGWIDPCQRSYQKICSKLGLPCYGTEEQFFKMTDKHAFKKMCIENNVDVIPEYTEKDLEQDSLDYPVYIKPVDSRGSRGQTICYNKKEVTGAIKIAKEESSNEDVLIEKYLADKNSFQVTYFFVNGKAHILRTADGYKGLIKDRLDKVALCSISPSIYTEEYLETADANVVKMLENLGIRNGPAMLQGFYDNGAFRFYDPGLRFPGVDFDRIYKQEYNLDIMEAMIIFALTGEIPNISIEDKNVFLSGKKAAILFPTISAGIIEKIEGLEELVDWPNVYSVLLRYKVGEHVDWSFNVKQRLAEIDLLADDQVSLKRLIQEVQRNIKVYDIEGKDMIYKPFDVSRLLI